MREVNLLEFEIYRDERVVRYGRNQNGKFTFIQMFKASRKLYQAFHDIKRLTRKYLLKVTKIKAKKKIAAAEIEEKKKRDEI